MKKKQEKEESVGQRVAERAREILQQHAEDHKVEDCHKEDEVVGQEKMLKEVISHEKEEEITQDGLKFAATTEIKLQKVDSTSAAAVQNVTVSPAEQLQKVDEVEENAEKAAKKYVDAAEEGSQEDDQDMHDVAEILVSQRMSEGHDEMDSQEIEQAENQTGFDLNVEDPSSYLNVYQDAQPENNEEVFQEAH